MNIPFTKPYWGNEEIRAATKSLKTALGTGDGPDTKELVTRLSKLLSIPYVLPVTSCTHGLELILSCMHLSPGDEVIVPSFTMSSTANAVLIAGATPVFADIESTRYTIDPEDIKRCITPHTKGIILVHYAGMPCFMEEIQAIAKKHRLFLVEDAAHTIGATYKGKALGTFGVAASFSFHGTKNVCCGEGGAVVTRDKALADAMELYRANGTNRREFLRGTVDKYTWVGKGTSFFLSDTLAGILNCQLKKIPVINAKRQTIAKRYTKAFEPYQDRIQLPVIPVGTTPNWHIYGIKFKEQSDADMFFQAMRNAGIGVSTHYVPLHSSPMGRLLAKKSYRPLPVTEEVAQTLIRLPIYPGLSKKEIGYIIKTATTLLKKMH